MTPSPLLLILGTLLELFEQRLDEGGETSRPDLLFAGQQLHRLNGLYIRLVESTIEPLPPPPEPPDWGELG